ncbi:MAG: hypothetical protein HC933_21205 [Pleurocapsa sp. SU_196_0]|nr:hypothetical protein [Pleurocapsa sp. SU_196_0]
MKKLYIKLFVLGALLSGIAVAGPEILGVSFNSAGSAPASRNTVDLPGAQVTLCKGDGC